MCSTSSGARTWRALFIILSVRTCVVLCTYTWRGIACTLCHAKYRYIGHAYRCSRCVLCTICRPVHTGRGMCTVNTAVYILRSNSGAQGWHTELYTGRHTELYTRWAHSILGGHPQLYTGQAHRTVFWAGTQNCIQGGHT